ncbi:MAG: hypothetical protein Q7R32_11170 [Dehalococcoidia bacterium]|nr:hypothetical protein [Dehalococcoidia bacterium]
MAKGPHPLILSMSKDVPTTQGYEAKIAEWLARLREHAPDVGG